MPTLAAESIGMAFSTPTGGQTACLYSVVMGGQFNDNGGRFEITVGVPEPKRWATLIAGFHLVSTSKRRRRLVQG